MNWREAHERQVASLEKVAKDGARQNFEVFGNIKPLALVLITRDVQTGAKLQPTSVILPLDLSSEEAKDATSHALHQFTDLSEAVALVIIAEVWYATYPGATEKDFPKLPRPVTRPDREEYVLVQLETQLGTKGWMAKITRRPDGSGILGPWKLDESQFSGRMTGFIRSPSAGEA